MAKNGTSHVRRVKLSDFKDRKADEGAIEIVTDDEQIWRVPPPELWSDDVLTLSTTNPLAAAELLIGGPEKYAAFVLAGGSAMLVMGIVNDEHGETLPQ